MGEEDPHRSVQVGEELFTSRRRALLVLFRAEPDAKKVLHIVRNRAGPMGRGAGHGC